MLRAEERRKEDEIRRQQEEKAVAAALANAEERHHLEEERGAPELPSPRSLAQQEALIAEPNQVPFASPLSI